ncbi:MAG: hypothetical protein ACREDU_10580, partial [Methylocella sp.]
LRDAQNADVDADMAVKFAAREAETVQSSGHRIARVIADQEEWRNCLAITDTDRGWIMWAEEIHSQ